MHTTLELPEVIGRRSRLVFERKETDWIAHVTGDHGVSYTSPVPEFSAYLNDAAGGAARLTLDEIDGGHNEARFLWYYAEWWITYVSWPDGRVLEAKITDPEFHAFLDEAAHDAGVVVDETR